MLELEDNIQRSLEDKKTRRKTEKIKIKNNSGIIGEFWNLVIEDLYDSLF